MNTHTMPWARLLLPSKKQEWNSDHVRETCLGRQFEEEHESSFMRGQDQGKAEYKYKRERNV